MSDKTWVALPKLVVEFCRDVKIGVFDLRHSCTYDADRYGYLVTLQVGPDPWHCSVMIPLDERERGPDFLINNYLRPMKLSLEQAVLGREIEFEALELGACFRYDDRFWLVGKHLADEHRGVCFDGGVEKRGKQLEVVHLMDRKLQVTRGKEIYYGEMGNGIFFETGGEVWLHSTCGPYNVRTGGRFDQSVDAKQTLLTVALV